MLFFYSIFFNFELVSYSRRVVFFPVSVFNSFSVLLTAQALCWDRGGASRGPAVVLCEMFLQEEGQETQKKETQTTLRLCKTTKQTK